MAASGGKGAQQSSSKTEMTRVSDSGDGAVDCSDHTALLQVFLVKAGSDAGIEELSLKASGPTQLPPGQSAADTGLVDFGEVDPGDYTLEVELNDEQKKKYKLPKKPKKVKTAGGHLTKAYVELAPFAHLRVVLLGYDAASGDDTALGDLDWTMSSPVETSGKTKPDGLIEVPIEGDDSKGSLSVTLAPAPGPVPAADPDVARDATAYPPKVQPQLYRDEDKRPAIPPREALIVKWKLDIAPPDVAAGEAGTKLRLRNLGFSCSDKSKPKEVERAVSAYQLLYADDREGSGKLADIADGLKTRHDEA